MSAEPILGMYRGSVSNNQDPLNEARVTLLIPQVLGSAESAWAVPASPTNTVPPVGQTLWVQFSGGDLTKPVYSPLGIKDVQDAVDGLPTGDTLDTLPPKEPTALTLTTVQYVTNEGSTLARVQASWTAPTENQDGTNLTDLAHYLLQYSYDGTNWSGGLVTQDTLVVLDGLHTGVDVTVRVQAVDISSNVSLWASAHITSASSSTPPPVPSAPGVTGVLGGLRVTWDGKDASGFAMPAIFSHVQVQRDTDPAFSNPVVVGTLPGADFLYDSVQNYASAYNYRLVAYSKVAIASAPSAANSGTAKQAGTTDLAANSVTANQIAAGSITAESGIIASLNADKITTGTLDASKAHVVNLDASSIKAGAINAEHLSVGTVSGNLVTNGGFEDTARSGWTLTQSDGTLATTAAKIEIAQGGYPARSGQGKLALGVNNLGTATATSDPFPVIAGSVYMLRYWYYGIGHLHVTFETSPDKITWTDRAAGVNDVTYNSASYTEDIFETTIPTGAQYARVSFQQLNPGSYGLSTTVFSYICVDDVLVMREGYGATDISAGGLRLYGPDGSLETELTSTNAHATFAGGAASIDPNGVGTFNSLWTPVRPDTATSDDPVGQIWYQGKELSDLLWNMPWGVVSYERTFSGRPTSTTYYTAETGLIELAFTAIEGRMYRIKARSQFDLNGGTGIQEMQNAVTYSGTTVGLNGCTIFTPNGASPRVTDTIICRAFSVFYDGAGTDGTCGVEGLFVCSSDGGGLYGATSCLAPGDHRLLWTATIHSGNATGWGLRNYSTAQSSDFYIEDVGPAIPENGVFNTGGAAVTAIKTYTKTYKATWSRRFGNAGSTDGSMYQGYYSSTWGTQKSMVGFGTQPYTDMGSTAKVTKVEIYLYANHWYYNAGGTAHIGTHTQTAAPSSATSSNNLTVTSWPVGAGKWVTLPSSWNTGWNAATPYRGITVGGDLGTSTNKTYYGIFDGYGDTHPPQLRITYTK
jgi:hypothetical protein